MIKSYETQNGIKFETLTIPKGTVLFRGLILEENMDNDKLFADLIGYHNGDAYMIPPTQNVFFYPAPYVSQVVDQFNIHVIYITNYDLELLLLIRPSEHHRGTRHNDNSEISELITTCTSISHKDKCGFQMKKDDACFTDKIIQEYDNIKGYIAIANTDSGKIINQLTKLYEKNNINKLHQILSSIASNAKDDIGIPEIVLHPLHLRRPICEITRKRMWLNEHYVQYSINNRSKFNYFPLLYVTENNIYSFEDLRRENVIDDMKKTQLPITFIPQMLFSRLNGVLDMFLSPEGYTINNHIFNFTVDLRTGFYRILIENSSNYMKSRNKTLKSKNGITESSLLNYSSLEPELADNKFTIPVKFPKKEKYMIMRLIGQNLHKQSGTEYDYLDEIESRLNLGNLSLSSYIFDKGKKHKKIFEISRVLDRPDLYKNKRPYFKNNQVYQEIAPRNKITKTRKNINNLIITRLNNSIFDDSNDIDEGPNESS